MTGVTSRVARRLVAFPAVCLASQSACADKRVAFVVGNSRYQNVVALPNPANDAAGIASIEMANAEIAQASRKFMSAPVKCFIPNNFFDDQNSKARCFANARAAASRTCQNECVEGRWNLL